MSHKLLQSFGRDGGSYHSHQNLKFWVGELERISPTKKNIFDRRIIFEDLYPLCHSSSKNIVHLLRVCLFIRSGQTHLETQRGNTCYFDVYV